MTTMLFYDRTVARFLPLLCSNLNLLYGGVPVRRAGAPNSMANHATRRRSLFHNYLPLTRYRQNHGRLSRYVQPEQPSSPP